MTTRKTVQGKKSLEKTTGEPSPFILNDYNHAPPFASFLPGLAGEEGVPMWAFTVNRGQAIASFGVRNKDAAILEFYPADRAWSLVPSRGFRTFIRLRGDNNIFHEPFQRTEDKGVSQRLIVAPHQVAVEETCGRLSLHCRAEMFTLPGEPLAGLVRKLTIQHRGRKPITLEVVDGLPQILPYGFNHWCAKNISRTLEAFIVTEWAAPGVPFYRLKVDPADRPDIQPIVEGHFFAALAQVEGRARPGQVWVDPRRVFGDAQDFLRPEAFLHPRAGHDQALGNRTPSGFQQVSARLQPGETLTLYGFYGHASDQATAAHFVRKKVSAAFFGLKQKENAALVDRVVRRALTWTGDAAWDATQRQTALDNGLRGGSPIPVPGGPTLYLFGRKHGDLERDYNDFFLNDSPYSEGNGDFRDVLQNRRLDVWFEPRLTDQPLRYFFSLIQADGHNPLVVRNRRWRFSGSAPAGVRPEGPVARVLSSPFKYGELWRALEAEEIPRNQRPALLQSVWSQVEENIDAEFEKGYWIDHWTYLADLAENFLGFFPEKWRPLLLEEDALTFYDSAMFIKPRSEKYRVTPQGVRQYGAVEKRKDKEQLMSQRGGDPHQARDHQGGVVRISVLGKILTLLVNKLAGLDPFQAGLEMEADRPGWCDSLNGLPGLLGSSSHEVMALKRLVDVVRPALEGEGEVQLPGEVVDFMIELEGLLRAGAELAPLEFWDRSHQAKERYRARVFMGFEGRREGWSLGRVRQFIDLAAVFLDRCVARSVDAKTGRVTSYYINEVADYTLAEGVVQVKKFFQKTLPVFLEGVVHALRLAKTPAEASRLWAAARRSPLYDAGLGMFKLNAPLKGFGVELGRIGIFAPGWLENGSIFLHMHYKFVLEMARRGLAAQVLKDRRRLLVGYHDPARYGRNPAELSSFVVSDVFRVDPAEHGRGYVARLSGSTVEALHLTRWLFLGSAPFAWKEGELVFQPQPTLDDSFFTSLTRVIHPWGPEGESVTLPSQALAFFFPGETLLIYEKSSRGKTATCRGFRGETWGGECWSMEGPCLRGDRAKELREGRYKMLRVLWG